MPAVAPFSRSKRSQVARSDCLSLTPQTTKCQRTGSVGTFVFAFPLERCPRNRTSQARGLEGRFSQPGAKPKFFSARDRGSLDTGRKTLSSTVESWRRRCHWALRRDRFQCESRAWTRCVRDSFARPRKQREARHGSQPAADRRVRGRVCDRGWAIGCWLREYRGPGERFAFGLVLPSVALRLSRPFPLLLLDSH